VTVTVGKARDNDLVIDDPTVSRRHFSTFHAEAGFEVREKGPLATYDEKDDQSFII